MFVDLVFRRHKECFNGVCTCKMLLYSLVFACLFESFTLSMYVRDYYGNVPVVGCGVGGGRLGVPGTWISIVVLLFKLLL